MLINCIIVHAFSLFTLADFKFDSASVYKNFTLNFTSFVSSKKDESGMK